jgi:hypothetical protein
MFYNGLDVEEGDNEMFGPNNFYMLDKLAEIKMRTSLHEADLYRLVNTNSSTPGSRLLVQTAWTLGSVAIALGTWLQTRPGGFHYR